MKLAKYINDTRDNKNQFNIKVHPLAKLRFRILQSALKDQFKIVETRLA